MQSRLALFPHAVYAAWLARAGSWVLLPPPYFTPQNLPTVGLCLHNLRFARNCLPKQGVASNRQFACHHQLFAATMTFPALHTADVKVAVAHKLGTGKMSGILKE